MIVLGLDPGIARTGFGVIDVGREASFIRCGCLTTPPSLSTANRLLTIGQDLETIINEFNPECAVVETVLFGNNAKTAMLTAETRGVLLYVLRQHHIEVQSLTPLQIKSRLTGYGAADKHQIQHVVTKRLNLNAIPQPDDAADALAGALCYIDQSLLISLSINNSPQ
jgi:crossover junction endodeoxyribonuclease RuvC